MQVGRPSLASSNSDARLQPLNAAYDPEMHAAVAFKSVQWHELVQTVERLRVEVNEHAGQLKSLVKENFDRFISSKDTVDDVAARLRAAEAEGGAGVHGATPAAVAAGLTGAQDATHGMFGQLLVRQSRAEGLDHILSVLDEYDGLVTLPSQLRSCAEAKDFAGVVALYKKAVKTVQERQEGSRDARAVWEKLKEEVDRVSSQQLCGVATVRAGPCIQYHSWPPILSFAFFFLVQAMASALHILEATVNSPLTSPSAAYEAVVHLAQLQEANVPAAAGRDPLGLFLAAQERSLRETIADIHRQFQDALEAHAPDGNGEPGHNNLQSMAPFQGILSVEEPLLLQSQAVRCLACITQAVVVWMEEFWGTTQRKSNAETKLWQGRTQEAERTVESILIVYDETVSTILNSHIAAALHASSSLASLEQCRGLVASIADGCSKLEKSQSVPPNSVPRLKTAVVRASQTVCSAALVLLRSIAQHLASTSAPGGAYATSVQAAAAPLGLLLSHSMRFFDELRAEANKAGVAAFDKSSQCHPCRALCALATEFALEMAETMQTSVTAARGTERQADRSLLQAWGALESIKMQVVPRIAAAWETLLLEDLAASDVRAGLRQCYNDIGGAAESLIKTWVDRKMEVLDLIMEEFLAPVVPPEEAVPPTAQRDARALAATWASSAPPQAARPTTWTLIATIGAVRSELVGCAPSLAEEVMAEVVQSVLGGVAELLKSGMLTDCREDAVYQLWVDLAVVRAAVEECGEEVGEAAAMAEQLCSSVEAALRQLQEDVDDPAAGGVVSMVDRRQWVEKVCKEQMAVASAAMVSLRPVRQ